MTASERELCRCNKALCGCPMTARRKPLACCQANKRTASAWWRSPAAPSATAAAARTSCNTANTCTHHGCARMPAHAHARLHTCERFTRSSRAEIETHSLLRARANCRMRAPHMHVRTARTRRTRGPRALRPRCRRRQPSRRRRIQHGGRRLSAKQRRRASDATCVLVLACSHTRRRSPQAWPGTCRTSASPNGPQPSGR